MKAFPASAEVVGAGLREAEAVGGSFGEQATPRQETACGNGGKQGAGRSARVVSLAAPGSDL